MKRLFTLLGMLLFAGAGMAQCSVDIQNVYGDCMHDCSGFVNAAALSGTAPFTYSWSNGDTGTQADSLCLDSTYIVTMTDGLGCVAYDTIIMSLPLLATFSHSVSNTSCPTCCDGSDTLNVTITLPTCLPLQYQWIPHDANPTTSNIRNNLCAMSYTIMITSSCLCANGGAWICGYGSSSIGYDTLTGITNAENKNVEIRQMGSLVLISSKAPLQRVSLSDMEGRELEVHENPGATNAFNLENYASQAVILSVISEGKRTTRKYVHRKM